MLEQATTAAAGFTPAASVATAAGTDADVAPEGNVVNAEPGDAERAEILAAAAAAAMPTGIGNGNSNGGGYAAAPAVEPPPAFELEPVLAAPSPVAMAEPDVSDGEEFAHAFVPVGETDAESDVDDSAGEPAYEDVGDMPDSRATPDNPEEL